MALGVYELWIRKMTNQLRLSACLFILLLFNSKAFVIDRYTVKPYTSWIGENLSGVELIWVVPT